jgi:uncharacterized MAPEG superfamily protein
MNATMTTELFWLLLTTFMTGVMWVPYIINRIVEQGPGQIKGDRQGTTATAISWADRMMRAHQNAVENLVVFVPLVLMVQLTGINNGITATACAVYFFARLAHYLVFTFGMPVLRVFTFAIGVACQLVLVFTLFGVT